MNLVYRTYRPYGAPLVVFRGAATRDQAVKDTLKACGCRWDSRMHGWATYAYDSDIQEILAEVAKAAPDAVIVAGDDA